MKTTSVVTLFLLSVLLLSCHGKTNKSDDRPKTQLENSVTGATFFYQHYRHKMRGEPFNKEAEFLKTLPRTTTYKIENNRLTLSNPDGELLTFKKID